MFEVISAEEARKLFKEQHDAALEKKLINIDKKIKENLKDKELEMRFSAEEGTLCDEIGTILNDKGYTIKTEKTYERLYDNGGDIPFFKMTIKW
ncbi:hypothetical protein D3C81_08630 [compost metagenome]